LGGSGLRKELGREICWATRVEKQRKRKEKGGGGEGGPKEKVAVWAKRGRGKVIEGESLRVVLRLLNILFENFNTHQPKTMQRK
jgi:hypothetical protein